jgi:hypothetical protein
MDATGTDVLVDCRPNAAKTLEDKLYGKGWAQNGSLEYRQPR